MTRTSTLLIALFAGIWFTAPAVAQDQPLGGKVKDILLGSWVKVDEPAGLTVELALENCAKPMISEAYLNTPGRGDRVDELPPWRSLKGDFAFFEHDGNFYSAGPTMIGFSASLYALPRMISEDLRALIIGIHTWSHSPNSGFSQTSGGTVLDLTPVQLAIQNGLVFTDQFLLQVGHKNESLIALLLTNVDRNGGRTTGSVEYIRCGDIAAIVNP